MKALKALVLTSIFISLPSFGSSVPDYSFPELKSIFEKSSIVWGINQLAPGMVWHCTQIGFDGSKNSSSFQFASYGVTGIIQNMKENGFPLYGNISGGLAANRFVEWMDRIVTQWIRKTETGDLILEVGVLGMDRSVHRFLSKSRLPGVSDLRYRADSYLFCPKDQVSSSSL